MTAPTASPNPDNQPWWYEPPVSIEVLDARDRLHPKVFAAMDQIDRWPPAKIAEVLEWGLIDGWPWELTRAGRAALSGGRRSQR